MGNDIKINDLLRMIGIMAVAVGAAWAIQVLGFGGSSTLARMAWILGAATIAGGGTGLIFAAATLPTNDGSARARA